MEDTQVLNKIKELSTEQLTAKGISEGLAKLAKEAADLLSRVPATA